MATTTTTPFVEVHDQHGRVIDPSTGLPLDEGQEGPGSIFHVANSDSHGQQSFHQFGDKKIPFSEVMQKLRDAGFEGGHMLLHNTPRPEDLDRVPSPPPPIRAASDHLQASGVEFAFGDIYRTECAYCWAALRGKERTAGFRLREIQQQAAKGCSTCSVLSEGITGFADMIFTAYDAEKVRIRQKDSGKTGLLSETRDVSVCFDEHGAEVIKLTFRAAKAGKALYAIDFSADGLTFRKKETSERILDTSAYATVLLIKDWMRTCVEEHPLCAIPTVSALPARVLEVSNHRVRVIETQGKFAPYLTLSHCWGRSPVLRLLKDNLEARKNNVPWKDLTKTFQDAVILTWRLGYRYLWIDSLCIVQDSTGDWEYHVAIMAQIYSNSQLTISASHAAAGSEGCFSARLHEPYILRKTDAEPIRHPKLWHPQSFNGLDRDGCPKTFEVRLHPPHGLYQDRRPREPLLKRAWVFQEQILSPRIVHFASGEVYFECKSHLTCECSGWSLRSQSHQWETRWRKAHAVLMGQKADVPEQYFTPATRTKIFNFEAYRGLLETYTELDITNEMDRLPALSGVTFGRKDEYLAGMWKSMLVESLHWYPVSQSPRGMLARRPLQYRAPTWSWASVEAPIRHIIDDFYKTPLSAKCIATIVDVSVTPAGRDTRGRVSDGYLRVQAPTLEVEVVNFGTSERMSSENERWIKSATDLMPDAVDLSLATYSRTRDLATHATIRSEEAEERCYLDIPHMMCRSEPAEVFVGQRLLCLMISTSVALVLKPVDPTTYTRVGILKPKSSTLRFVVNDISIVIK